MATIRSFPDEDPNRVLDESNKSSGEKADHTDLLCPRANANANIQLEERNRAVDDDDEKAQQLQPDLASGFLKTRHDWYQTESQVVVTIMMKNAKKDDVFVTFSEKQLTAEVKLLSEEDYCLKVHLLHPIVPEQSTFRILSTKIEIKMKKTEAIRWEKLEGEGTLSNVKHFTPNQYPSSSHYTRNWDKVVGEISEEEKSEKLEGDAALNKLFQQIYSDGSDEVRRAMNKSFMESGGTVLSTNWTDVGKRKVEMNPPEDVEWKKY